ncbi:MAG TPA: hypothetical protein VF586_22420, partial [Pyrinomonadaceae bacterium]
MSVIRRIISISTSALLLAGPVLGQDAAGQRGTAGPAVAASSTASGVRFVAPGEARRVRLEIYTAAGERLFDSGFRAGGIYDWDGRGLADGSYLCVLTAEDIRGGQSRKLSAVAVEGGRAALGKEGEEQLKASYAQALTAAGIKPGDAEAAARARKSNAVTVAAHDGTDGQVTSTSGSLTFRTGDVFSGQEREQMRVTPEGRVGIGTATPEDALDVAGTIRARGGIRFDDGTVLTSAGALKSKSNTNVVAGNALAAGGPTASFAGTGTANKLSKWLDGSGTLGDSVISEVNGNIGVGTSDPGNVFEVRRDQPFNGSVSSHTQLVVRNDNPNGFSSVSIWGNGAERGRYQYNSAQPNIFLTSIGQVPFYFGTSNTVRMSIDAATGNVGIGTLFTPATQKLEVNGNIKVSTAGNGIIFPDGSKLTSANPGGGAPSGTTLVGAINDAGTVGVINDNRLSANVARLNGANAWTGANVFGAGLSANNALITNVGNPVNAGDATNKAYTDANFVKFVPGAEQLSVGDANGTAPMINLRGGSTCCSGPGGHTPAWFKVFQNGSFVATGNLGIGVSPMQGKGYRTSWDSYKGAFRSGYADNEWDDNNVGFFSWAGGSNSTAIGLYALAFGDTNSAESTSSIVFGSGNQVKGAAGFSAGAGNRVCDTYGVALGNNAKSGGPLINGKCDPDTFNIRGLAAVAIGYNVTADQDHTTAKGKFASNNGFTGTFIWSDGAAQQTADTFRNTANNEFAARATGGFRFRTNLGGTTGCNLPAG